MPYVMREALDADEPGVFAPRGGAKQLWQYRGPAAMLSGPAETGKTWSCIQKLDALLWKYPGAQASILRKTQTSIYGSALVTYKRIIGEKSPIRTYGGEKPEFFQYPNGSRLWIGGMDNANRVLSSERDFIYVVQAEELTLDDWEYLRTRATGRGAGKAPYAQMIGDCNPWSPTHWIKQLESSGALKMFESRHEDNPTLFTDDGGITEQGRRSLAALDSLTGVRYKRLRLGLWVTAEGQVYDGYDPAIHLIERFDPRYGLQDGVPDDWPRSWAIDFGYKNPFVWQEWVRDHDGRLFLHREIYKTMTLVEDHAQRIKEITQSSPRPRHVITDHDAEDRATLERKLGVTTVAAYKSVSDGIQAVASRFKPAGDGKARLFLMRDSEAAEDRDLRLIEAKQPACTAEEIANYIWDESNGRGRGEDPIKRSDHGMDAMRYEVAKEDGLAPVTDKKSGYNPVKFVTGLNRR